MNCSHLFDSAVPLINTPLKAYLQVLSQAVLFHFFLAVFFQIIKTQQACLKSSYSLGFTKMIHNFGVTTFSQMTSNRNHAILSKFDCVFVGGGAKTAQIIPGPFTWMELCIS